MTKFRTPGTIAKRERQVHKTNDKYRDDYKAHVAVEPETGLVTSCALTPATPLTVLPGWAAGGRRVRSRGHRPLGLWIRVPGQFAGRRTAPDHQAHRAAHGGTRGFSRNDFTVDLDARTVTCPNNIAVHIADHNSAFSVSGPDVRLRSRCTIARRDRVFKIHPHESELIRCPATGTRRRLPGDLAAMATMVERTIAWLVANGKRRVRYRGVERNQLGLSLGVAAINLRRLIRLGLDHDPGGWILTT